MRYFCFCSLHWMTASLPQLIHRSRANPLVPEVIRCCVMAFLRAFQCPWRNPLSSGEAGGICQESASPHLTKSFDGLWALCFRGSLSHASARSLAFGLALVTRCFFWRVGFESLSAKSNVPSMADVSWGSRFCRILIPHAELIGFLCRQVSWVRGPVALRATRIQNANPIEVDHVKVVEMPAVFELRRGLARS